MATVTSLLADAIVGVVTGIVVLVVVEIIKKLFFKKKVTA
jgi:predicted DNA repair protein MutK